MSCVTKIVGKRSAGTSFRNLSGLYLSAARSSQKIYAELISRCQGHRNNLLKATPQSHQASALNRNKKLTAMILWCGRFVCSLSRSFIVIISFCSFLVAKRTAQNEMYNCYISLCSDRCRLFQHELVGAPNEIVVGSFIPLLLLNYDPCAVLCCPATTRRRQLLRKGTRPEWRKCVDFNYHISSE